MDSTLKTLQLQTLLNQTAVGIAATDASGRMTLLSPALQALFGLRPDLMTESEFVDRFDLYAEDGVTRLRPEDVPLTRARGGELVRDAVITARIADGSLAYLRCNAAPLRDDDGTINGAITLVQDITAERAALREQGELRHRLVDTINHEFRTPLAAVLGHAELLHDIADELPPSARHSLDRMVDAGQRLTDLVRTLSELADLEADTQLAKTYGDVVELVRDTVHEVDGPARDRELELVVDAPATLAVTVDPRKLRKAFRALLDNAVAHAPTGSGVCVGVSRRDGWFDVVVADSGAGIPPRERDRLVQPFERGTEDPGPPATGRGLGLAIAQTVATAHGGSLTLEANEPRGLCARLTLPVHGQVPLGGPGVAVTL